MKKAAILLFCFTVLGFSSVYFSFRDNAVFAPDAAAINDMIMTIEQSGTDTGSYFNERLTEIYKDMDVGRNHRDTRLLIILYGLVGICAALFAGLLLYCERNIFAPFRNLKWFALKIVAGELDIPLEMDKQGIFGAFTESFDLMRVELIRARDDERIAREKQESLIKQLSKSNAKIECYL